MSVREDLIAKFIAELDNLSEEQMSELLRGANWMIANSPQIYDPAKDPLLQDYDESKDGTIGGMKSAIPDLASRSKEILRAEFGLRKPYDEDANE